MQEGSPPLKIPLPWATGASSSFIRPIPTASQIGISNGAASWTDGFPPLNLTALSAGGVPPFGQDANGALNQISAGLQWLQAAGPLLYDPTFATSIGGYPKGAIVTSTTFPYRWLCTVDNNVSNPDAGGAGWTLLPIVHGMQWFTTTQSWTLPASQVFVKVWGAGGGGGASSNSVNTWGTGGGGGGYSEGMVTGLTLGASIAITVGAGGTGGFAANANGNPGNTSSFGSYISATGGGGGAGNGDGFGLPGLGSGGAINFSGVAGSFGIVYSGTGTLLISGIGGYSFGGASNTIGAPGTSGGFAGPGLFPGVGGNGGGTVSTNSTSGGTGANGLIIVSW